MKKLLMLLVLAGMLIGVVGCNINNKIHLGMTLQRFLLGEIGRSAQLQHRNDEAEIKQQLWVYGYDTDEEQCFLFHDKILVDWQD